MPRRSVLVSRVWSDFSVAIDQAAHIARLDGIRQVIRREDGSDEHGSYRFRISDAECTCPYTDPSTWLSAASCGYGSGYEPGSMQEWNPDCPLHAARIVNPVDEPCS